MEVETFYRGTNITWVWKLILLWVWPSTRGTEACTHLVCAAVWKSLPEEEDVLCVVVEEEEEVVEGADDVDEEEVLVGCCSMVVG